MSAKLGNAVETATRLCTLEAAVVCRKEWSIYFNLGLNEDWIMTHSNGWREYTWKLSFPYPRLKYILSFISTPFIYGLRLSADELRFVSCTNHLKLYWNGISILVLRKLALQQLIGTDIQLSQEWDHFQMWVCVCVWINNNK